MLYSWSSVLTGVLHMLGPLSPHTALPAGGARAQAGSCPGRTSVFRCVGNMDGACSSERSTVSTTLASSCHLELNLGVRGAVRHQRMHAFLQCHSCFCIRARINTSALDKTDWMTHPILLLRLSLVFLLPKDTPCTRSWAGRIGCDLGIQEFRC